MDNQAKENILKLRRGLREANPTFYNYIAQRLIAKRNKSATVKVAPDQNVSAAREA